ncbi:MAG: DUF190 domain-containing protein [Deltaproteobacteria bacterium]|nr:DUF190 domain-containing protein [Deltaproteobacteria bacterium]
MNGYQVTFFTQQKREHDGLPVATWIVETARRLGIGGATLMPGSEGFGHDGRSHSDNYFDFEDRPLLVVLALTPDESDRLFSRIKESRLRVFYTKCETEFGFTT